jgi:hypothetical protein
MIVLFDFETNRSGSFRKLCSKIPQGAPMDGNSFANPTGEQKFGDFQISLIIGSLCLELRKFLNPPHLYK